MTTGKKFRIKARSLRHKIKDNFGRFVNENHMMSLDPFDHALFAGKYEPSTQGKEK